MSPDPLGGELSDPQTLNKYSYVRDNPLNMTDPTGLYTCADSAKCDSKDDKAFEAARQHDLKSNDADVRRAAASYGKPTVDDGTTVEFGNPGNGNNGVTTGHGFRPDKNNPGHEQAVSTVTIKSGLRETALDAAVGHEGSHVADRQDFAATINTNTGDFDVSKNLTEYQTEVRAYTVMQTILAASNSSNAGYGVCGIGGDPCKFGTGLKPVDVAGTIDNLLAKPANKYGTPPNYGISPSNPGPLLYPDWTKPH